MFKLKTTVQLCVLKCMSAVKQNKNGCSSLVHDISEEASFLHDLTSVSEHGREMNTEEI